MSAETGVLLRARLVHRICYDNEISLIVVTRRDFLRRYSSIMSGECLIMTSEVNEF